MTTTGIFTIEGQGLKLDSKEDVAKMCSEIKEIVGLSQVHLQGNTIGVGAAEALASAIKLHDSVKIVNLSDIFTGRLKEIVPVCLDFFVDALINQPLLEEINISDNALGPLGAKAIMPLIIQNRHIKEIKLMNNGLGIGGGEFIASALTEAARLNTESESPSNITTIVIGRNRLEKSAALIAKAVSLHENISVLGLPQNGIRPDVIVELFNHLSSLGKITTLDLQDNTFTLTGSRACAETIVNWKNSLCVLNVGECLLGEDGSILIIKALTGAFEKLQQLLLSYNEIDTQGAKLIPAMLSRKVYLVKLELNGNAFDADSDEVDDIRDALDSIGHSDALDELDDMEVSTDEEDDDDEDDVVENEVDDELVDAATKLAIT